MLKAFSWKSGAWVSPGFMHMEPATTQSGPQVTSFVNRA